ncbi:MAG TPA: RNA polymerase sigma-54 factor [Phycisphaerales bacterium]|nr:RNA polymerase sigma-54 factor [Phycisphaerales bacterium]
MRFETSQHMKLGQQMKLAPRMIQSMEILQMPLAELEERIEQELASNPTLELVEVEPDENAPRETQPDTDGELDLSDPGEADFARLDTFEEANPDAAANTFDEGGVEKPEQDRADHYEDRRSSARLDGEPNAKMEAMASAPARGVSLGEQLLAQWNVSDVSEPLRPIGAAIISFLDEDGYLRVPLEEIAEKSPRPAGVEPWPPAMEDMELALQAVQLLLEPAGVGARDVRECLLLQLDAQLDALDTADDGGAMVVAPVLRRARAIVDRHLDDLMKNRLPKIAEESGMSMDEIRSAIEALRRLSLAPGRRLVAERTEPIIPDAIVEYDEDNDRYVAYLNDSRLPNLRINREYAMMSKDRAVPKADRDFIKTNLSNARWLMDAVEQRRGTLLRVVRAVVEAQRDVFDHGIEALKPLPMTRVAEQLGVHVATVSRAVADKYILTPIGVLPLRGFFTGGLATESGEEVSANAVKAALKELIDNEDKAKPLSDEALAGALKEKGFEIARRTVAKYRGQMGIPGARMRKQF